MSEFPVSLLVSLPKTIKKKDLYTSFTLKCFVDFYVDRETLTFTHFILVCESYTCFI